MNFLLIGKLVKSYGLKGLLKANFYIDDFNELKNFTQFYIKDKKSSNGYKEINFSDIRLSNLGIIIEVAGCADRTQADLLRGVELFIDEDELPKLKKDSYYIKDLLDLDVYYKDNLFGKVYNIFETANKNMLMIKNSNGKEVVVPFENKYVEKVELTDKRVIIKDIDDLL